MKNLTLLLFLFIVTFSFSQENNFVIKDKKTIIILTLENNATTIELDKETYFTVTTIGMNPKKTSIIGSGISISNSENALGKNYIQCTTTVTEKAVVDGHYKILIGYNNKKKFKTYTFLIPVKTN
jgi:hypothetical protein